MRKFEISDRYTTADIGLAVEGDSLPELFRAAAEGMFAIILGPVGPRNIYVTRDIPLRSATGEQLLIDWLSDLIYLFDTEGLVPYDYRITIAEGGDYAISGAIDFGRYEAGRDTAEHEIKAVTYYKLQIERTGGRYRCHLVFDI
ncbi:MAG: archease [candidate division Zixibacteria bacterium]|nr:archease [candidate division Zixibacteria bacterium]